MKNIKIMAKSMDFCMKIVKNRSENVISNPDTDLIFFVVWFQPGAWSVGAGATAGIPALTLTSNEKIFGAFNKKNVILMKIVNFVAIFMNLTPEFKNFENFLQDFFLRRGNRFFDLE